MSTHEERLAALVQEFAECVGSNPQHYPGQSRWANFRETGSALWVQTADPEESDVLWSPEFSGIILSTPSLSKIVGSGQCDELISRVVPELPTGLSPDKAADEVRFVLEAAQGLMLARRFGIRVCINLNTHFIHDTNKIVTEALRFHAFSPDHFIIRIPLSAEGLVAARRLSRRHVPVTLTGAVSARQAFLAAVIGQPAYIESAVQGITPFITENHFGAGRTTAAVTALSGRYAVREANRLMNLRSKQVLTGLRSEDLVELVAGCDVLSFSAELVREYETRNVNTASIVSRVDSEPDIDIAPETDLESTGISSLWEIPKRLKVAMLVLARRNPEELPAQNIRDAFAHAGFPGLLAPWSDTDRARISTADSPPDFALWRGRIASGEIELDALLSLHNLCATAKAQKAIRDYIIGKL